VGCRSHIDWDAVPSRGGDCSVLKENQIETSKQRHLDMWRETEKTQLTSWQRYGMSAFPVPRIRRLVNVLADRAPPGVAPAGLPGLRGEKV